MIRTIQPTDLEQLQSLFTSINVFDSNDEIQFMLELAKSFISKTQEENHFLVVNDDNGINAAAYFAPETFVSGVYNLYFMGVLPKAQRSGIGAKLLQHVEHKTKSLDARILLVETSGLDKFEKAKNFYTKNGFIKEAVIREFYKKGDDKIIFWKKL